MSYLEIVDRVLEKQKEEKAKPQKIDISLLRLSELSKRNIAIKIYSEVLGCEIWLCGNEEMAAQLRQDDPGAMIYTANEMRKLLRLNPNSEDLKRIHTVKTLFNSSKIINSTYIDSIVKPH
ncbi:MAG: hypothetical protein ACM3SR_07775 [Ignavibacteriales bacterium]